ncbi:MAG: hypothetical protein IRY86_09000 [Thermorudis peleae]|nr:hypothetical protein [Thermorudis peleae]
MPGQDSGLAPGIGAIESSNVTPASLAALDPRPKIVRLSRLPVLAQVWVVMGLVLVVGSVVVSALPDWLAPSLPVPLPDGSVVAFSWPALVVGLATLLLAWTSALTAAALMRWPAGIITAGAVLVFMYPALLWPLDLLSGLPIGVAVVGLLGAYLVVRWSLARDPLLLVLDGLVFGGVGIALLVTLVMASARGGLTEAASFLVLVAATASVRLFPVQATLLFLTGVDLAEVSQFVGYRLSERLAGRSRQLGIGISLVLPLAWAAIWLFQTGGRPRLIELIGAGGLVAYLMLLSLLARGHPGPPLEPSLGVLLVLALPYAVGTTVTELMAGSRWYGAVQWLVNPAVLAPALALFLAPFMAWRARDHRWRWLAVLGTVGLLWPLTERGWLSVAPLSLVMSGVIAAVLLWRTWRRSSPLASLALGLGAAVSLSAAIGAEGLYYQLFRGHLPVAVSDLLFLFQFGWVGIGIVSRWRRIVPGACAGWLSSWSAQLLERATLFGAMLLVLLIPALTLPRGQADETSTPGNSILGNIALVLAIMLLWDFALSGERFTNGESATLPQVSRVLFYLAYSCSVPLGLLFGGVGGIGPAIFTDVIPAWGLLYLGVPLLLAGSLSLWHTHPEAG